MRQCKHHKGFFLEEGTPFCEKCHEELKKTSERLKDIFSRIDYDKIFKNSRKK